VDENDVTPGELFSSTHLMFHHLAVMDDKFEIEIAHRDAGPAFATRCLADAAKTPAELEIRALDRVLQRRAVDVLRSRIDECGVALEFGQAKRGTQPLHHRIHEIGDDVLRVVELDCREEAGVAGDVGNREISCFSLRKHRDLPCDRSLRSRRCAVCHIAPPAVEGQRNGRWRSERGVRINSERKSHKCGPDRVAADSPVRRDLNRKQRIPRHSEGFELA
jgi:hypothetical protein